MAEEFKVRIGAELNPTSFDNVKNQLNALQNNTYRVKVDLDATRVQKQINSIKRQIQNLSGIKINLTGGFGGSGVNPDFARVFGPPPFHQNHQLTYIKKCQVVLVVLVV